MMAAHIDGNDDDDGGGFVRNALNEYATVCVCVCVCWLVLMITAGESALKVFILSLSHELPLVSNHETCAVLCLGALLLLKGRVYI